MKIEQDVQHSSRGDPGAAIAAVARSHFRRFGYAKTSMLEIAGDCGMSAANLYRYYDGKLALGAAVAAAEQAALFATCDRAVAAAQGDLAAKLVTLFHALIDGTRRQIRAAPLLFELGMTVSRDQPGLRQQFMDEVEIRIAALLAAGERIEALAQTDSKAACRLILTASASFVLPWMIRTQPFGDPRPLVEPLVRNLVLGLRKAIPPGAVASTSLGDPH